MLLHFGKPLSVVPDEHLLEAAAQSGFHFSALFLAFDEPTAGLDPEQRITFRRLLRRLGESSSVVVATHLVEDVAAACDRVIVFAQGVIRFDGTPDALAAFGDRTDVEGDSPIERGYLAAVMGEA